MRYRLGYSKNMLASSPLFWPWYSKPHSIRQRALPASWKHAWDILVFKKGERARPSNYRPISLTCIACKCLENIIHSYIMDHLDNNAILRCCPGDPWYSYGWYSRGIIFPARVPQKKIMRHPADTDCPRPSQMPPWRWTNWCCATRIF